jgi:uncharacterized protein
MKPVRTFDPRRLDVTAAAAAAAELSGQWPLVAFERLNDGQVQDGTVAWSARFERRPARAGEPETWLRLAARTSVPLECQRCLQPVSIELAVDRALRFVADEAAAAALDADSDDDVLELPRQLDLLALVEDELLLALPLVPKHERCPNPLPTPAADVPPDTEQPAHPFAALGALKRGPGP